MGPASVGHAGTPRAVASRERWPLALGVGVLTAALLAFILLPSAPGLLFTKSSRTAFALVQVQHAIAISAMGIVLTAYR